MDKSLITKNPLYGRLLLSEWFYVAKESCIKRQKEIGDQVNNLKNVSAPVHPNETPIIDIVLGSVVGGIALIGGILLAWALGWKVWTDNSTAEKIVCCLIGGAVAIAGLVFFFIKLAKFLKGKKEEKKWKLQYNLYQKKVAANNEKVAPLQKEYASLEKERVNFEKAFNKSMEFIYPKYRNIVAVAQFTQYIESGRCIAFDGPHGCYNLYEQELRSDMIISKLDEISRKLDVLAENQKEMICLLQNIDKVAREISMKMDENILWTKMNALATMQIASELSDVSDVLKKLDSDVVSFDKYYRYYN